MANIVTPDGQVATSQGATVYVQPYGSFERFTWAGECVYIGDIADERGGLNVTTRGNAREGGIKRDGVLLDPFGNVTTTLGMKRVRGDKLKTLLKSCFWVLDKRTQCNDFDDPLQWSEIERVYRAKVNTRTTTPGTSIGGASTEEMVNFSITALEDWDIYRVHIENGTGPVAALGLLCIDACHGERCTGCGDSETGAVLVIGTVDDGANPHIFVNAEGGDVNAWTDITVTEWGANDVNGIVCLGDWGAAVSNGEAEVLYSHDRFTTRVAYTTADLTAHQPNAIDASSQSFIVIAGDDGYVYISRDGLVTCPLSSIVGAANFTGVRIAPSNNQVVYVWSILNNAIYKTENGGDTWFAATVTGGGFTASLAIHPDNENLVLAGTVDGQLYESEDGGQTWTEQTVIPGITTKADVTFTDIEPAGGGVWFAGVTETGTTTSRVYINYEDGASGAWEYYNPIDGEEYSAGLTNYIYALAAVNPNRCVVAATASAVALLS